jgi:hypothetical protein
MATETLPPELTPGAMAVHKERMLPSGHLVEFESAPAGWLTKSGTPRRDDWRAYHISSDELKRARIPSVTTLCDAILPKDGLPPWSERQGIRGALEAFRRGLLHVGMTDDEAVAAVRANQLGANAARDDAADRGLNIHAILEQFMATGRAPNPADHPEPHRPFIRGLVKWLLWADPEPVAVEFLVADPERRYAGRGDLIARIGGRHTLVDLKSQERGAIYESAHIQVRLYRQAEERFGGHQIEDARIVVVDGHGGFREMDLVCDDELAERALRYYEPVRRLCAACESQNRVVREALKERAA